VAALSRIEEERYARRKSAAQAAIPEGSDPVVAYLERARTSGGGNADILSALTAYRQYREETERREQVLLRLAAAGAASDMLLGQLSGSVAAINGLMPLIRQRLEELPIVDRLGQVLELVGEQLNALERVRIGENLSGVFDLRSLGQDALVIYAPILGTMGVEASVAGATGVSVTGDRGASLLALLHVVENAILATAERAARRRVTLEVLAGPSRIVVEDSGPGVTPEQQAFIFDPFFSTRDARAGLGLFFARRLLRRSGHDLRITGRGSAFELVFEPGTPGAAVVEVSPLTPG
jgi:signal transduction histidine kinase